MTFLGFKINKYPMLRGCLLCVIIGGHLKDENDERSQILYKNSNSPLSIFISLLFQTRFSWNVIAFLKIDLKHSKTDGKFT
jgi:hypothetical protein